MEAVVVDARLVVTAASPGIGLVVAGLGYRLLVERLAGREVERVADTVATINCRTERIEIYARCGERAAMSLPRCPGIAVAQTDGVRTGIIAHRVLDERQVEDGVARTAHRRQRILVETAFAQGATEEIVGLALADMCRQRLHVCRAHRQAERIDGVVAPVVGMRIIDVLAGGVVAAAVLVPREELVGADADILHREMIGRVNHQRQTRDGVAERHVGLHRIVVRTCLAEHAALPGIGFPVGYMHRRQGVDDGLVDSQRQMDDTVCIVYRLERIRIGTRFRQVLTVPEVGFALAHPVGLVDVIDGQHGQLELDQRVAAVALGDEMPVIGAARVERCAVEVVVVVAQDGLDQRGVVGILHVHRQLIDRITTAHLRDERVVVDTGAGYQAVVPHITVTLTEREVLGIEPLRILVDMNRIDTVAVAAVGLERIHVGAAGCVQSPEQREVVAVAERACRVLAIDRIDRQYQHVGTVAAVDGLTDHLMRATNGERVAVEHILLALADRCAGCVAQLGMDIDMITVDGVAPRQAGRQRIRVDTARGNMPPLEIEPVVAAEVYILVYAQFRIDGQVQMDDTVAALLAFQRIRVDTAFGAALAGKHDVLAFANGVVDRLFVARIDPQRKGEHTIATLCGSERHHVGVRLRETLAVTLQRVALTDGETLREMVGRVHLQIQPIDGVVAVDGLQAVPIDTRLVVVARRMILVIVEHFAPAYRGRLRDVVFRVERDGQIDNGVATLCGTAVVGIGAAGRDGRTEEIVGLADGALLGSVDAVAWQDGQRSLVDRVVAVLVFQAVPYHRRADCRAGQVAGVPLHRAVLAERQRCVLLEEGRIDSQRQSDDGVATGHRLQAVEIRTRGVAVLAVPDEWFLLRRDRGYRVAQVLRLLLQDQGIAGVTAVPVGEADRVRAVGPETLSVEIHRVAVAELLRLALLEPRPHMQLQAIDRVVAVGACQQTVVVGARCGIMNRHAVLVVGITLALADGIFLQEEILGPHIHHQLVHRVAAMHRRAAVPIDAAGVEIFRRAVTMPNVRYLLALEHIDRIGAVVGIPHLQVQTHDTVAETVGGTVDDGVRIHTRLAVLLSVPCFHIAGADRIVLQSFVLGFASANGHRPLLHILASDRTRYQARRLTDGIGTVLRVGDFHAGLIHAGHTSVAQVPNHLIHILVRRKRRHTVARDATAVGQHDGIDARLRFVHLEIRHRHTRLGFRIE